jgi:aryl-alcohol dehydrogenase-like predicted oxidoreductase
MNVEQMRLYGAHFELASLQPHYNLLFREVEARELPYCLENRIGVIPYSTLYRGLLAGKYQRGQTFTDHRASLPLFQGQAFERVLEGLEQLKPFADELGLSIAQFSIRWLLTQPSITSALVGVKRPEHIEGIAAAAEDILPNDIWHRAAEVMAKAKG